VLNQSSDITDRAAVEQLVDKIRQSFPPIAGIMHGAMVLEDVPFSEMSLETMTRVIRPKVLGAVHLDRLFRDSSLDFFVFFSSLASAVGNRGQSNYSAANMYMTAKTFERRRQGLAASVVHLGAVMGVGYVMREPREVIFPAIRRAGFQWIDERAFHQCIAEAILAGRPDSGRSPEIITGLRVVNVDEEDPVPWMDNPRFQHCISHGVADAGAKRTQGGAMVAVRARLFEITTPEEGQGVIADAFLQKLQVMLQIQLESSEDRANMLTANAEDTGIDSLVAVEIRAWFQKEMEVDVPVLKILGGATVADLVAFAFEKLPAALTPNLGNDSNVTKKEKGETGSRILVDPPLARRSATSDHVGSLATASIDDSEVQTSASSGATTPPPESDPRVASPTHDGDIEPGNQVDAGPGHPQALDVERTVPMSLGQSRFWFLNSYIEDQTTFNCAFSARLKGPLQLNKFEAAIQALGRRHQALRTAFVVQPDQQVPVQAVLRTSLLHLEKRQIREAGEASSAVEELTNHVFRIEQGESMRVMLLALNPTDHFLVMGYHHINMDGASLQVLLADLTNLYTGKPLTPRPHQYPDFAVQQRLEVQQGKMDQDIAYWKTQLAGLPPALPLLPFASVKMRTAMHRYDHNRVDRKIDAALFARIRGTCRQQKASQFHFYLAVLQATLFRLLDTPDLCIGMADANRFEGDLATSIGMYLNLLPLRLHPSAGQTFQDTLKATRRTAYEAMAHSRAPFDLVLDGLQIPRSTRHSPVFQAFINYRAGVAEKRTMGALEGEGDSEEYHVGRTAYDINLDIIENPNSDPRLMFVVQKHLYSEGDAGILADTFMHMLDYFAGQPGSTLGAAPAFAPSSVAKAIELGRGMYNILGVWAE